MLINSLGLKNFKCFEELDVKFAPITLLTGANSSGKSSLINAILAVLQTEQFPLYLSPNGKYVNMGSFEEIVFNRATKKNIEIFIEPYAHIFRNDPNAHSFRNDSKFKWVWKVDEATGLPKLKEATLEFGLNRLVNESWIFKVLEINNRYDLDLQGHANDVRFDQAIWTWFKNIDSIKDDIKSNDTFEIPRSAIILKKKFDDLKQISELYAHPNFIFRELLTNAFSDKSFNYIGSFRRPPERTYYRKAKAKEKVDTDGEGYIDQIIEWQDTDPQKLSSLINVMRHLELLHDVQASKLKGGRFDLNVKINSKAQFSSLTDVGFGISQFLPIIVADIQLSDSSCLAVSQPEIHLHPKIQALFGNYLVDKINSTNKQYIIETHSEYIINRIRLLLVTGELKPEDVRVLYFENDGVKSIVHDVEFTTKGAVRGAPTGFFDTYEMDVMDIAMQAIG